MTLKSTDKSNAVFKITNEQKFEERDDKIEVTTEGRFSFKNGAFFLVYKEYTELGEVSVLIKVLGDVVTIRRSGACSTRMEYIPGESHEIIYNVPFGKMVMELETFEIKNKLDEEKGGSLEMEYKLDINHEVYHNSMRIEISIDK